MPKFNNMNIPGSFDLGSLQAGQILPTQETLLLSTQSTQAINSNESLIEGNTPEEGDYSSSNNNVQEELERTLKLLIDENVEQGCVTIKEPQSATLLTTNKNFNNNPANFARLPPLKSLSLPLESSILNSTELNTNQILLPPTMNTLAWTFATCQDEISMQSFLDEDVENMAANSPSQNDKASPVLYIKGLNTTKTTLEQIYNLFSNYGNILKILYSPMKGNAALVEYDALETAAMAKHFLHNMPFLSGQLKCFFSNHESIKLKHTLSTDEYFVGSSKTNRFRESRPLSINPPSNILHISNLIPEACKTDLILPMFRPFGDIVAYKFLHDGSIKHMCLLKFAYVEQAINAVATLHNYYLMGRNMQISFTRSKI